MVILSRSVYPSMHAVMVRIASRGPRCCLGGGVKKNNALGIHWYLHLPLCIDRLNIFSATYRMWRHRARGPMTVLQLRCMRSGSAASSGICKERTTAALCLCSTVALHSKPCLSCLPSIHSPSNPFFRWASWICPTLFLSIRELSDLRILYGSGGEWNGNKEKHPTSCSPTL